MTGSRTNRSGRLTGRVAVVTGASSGIGRAVALQLVGEGATVIAIGRDETRLAGLAKEADGPGTLVAEHLDLTDDAARDMFAAELVASPTSTPSMRRTCAPRSPSPRPGSPRCERPVDAELPT